MNRPTLQQIARSFALWGEYVDTDGLDSERQFQARTLAGRLDFMAFCGMTDDADDATHHTPTERVTP